ncbi:MAG: OsmC family protein [Bernardetiaceae bacterium]|nr:OsmC family protein [Bernardetiaceae bacterium]
MKVHIKRTDALHGMEAQNQNQNTIRIDSSASGSQQGMSPMELLLAGIGGCSAIDIIDILNKQKQEIKDLQIDIEGERSNSVPKVFTKIHIQYHFVGDIAEAKAKRAIDLSIEKYCSVSQMLEKTAQISYTFDIKN